jgi:hypothetical protein
VIRLLGWLGLPVYALLLAKGILHPRDIEPLGSVALVAFAKGFVKYAAWEAARHAPLGMLAVFAMPPRSGFFARAAGMALPGFVLAAVVAAATLAVAGGAPRAVPGPFEMAAPLLGILFGVWTGMTVRRGILATVFFLPKLAVLGVVLAAAGLYTLWSALDAQPLPFESPEVTLADKRRLSEALKLARPTSADAGRVDLRLAPRDLDLLLAWGLSMGGRRGKARFEVPGETMRFEASARLPRLERYLNVVAEGTIEVAEGRFDLHARQLQVGRIPVPRALLIPLAFAVEKAVSTERRLRPTLESLHQVAVRDGHLLVSYDRQRLPGGVLVRFLQAEPPTSAEAAALRAQVANLQATVPRLPADGDALFETALQSAFAAARLRSRAGDPVVENRAALLALGLAIGSSRLEGVTGRVAEPAAMAALRRAYRGARMRGRADWARHFTVSGALQTLFSDGASDAAGLFKEELDADGGSGFSFADLLADRAGTRFAAAATAGAPEARALQERAATGLRVTDVLPAADGLPEGIPEGALREQYGGVGGAEYVRLVQEIERRLAALSVAAR